MAAMRMRASGAVAAASAVADGPPSSGVASAARALGFRPGPVACVAPKYLRRQNTGGENTSALWLGGVPSDRPYASDSSYGKQAQSLLAPSRVSAASCHCLAKAPTQPGVAGQQGGCATPASLPAHWLVNCHCFAKAPTQPGVAKTNERRAEQHCADEGAVVAKIPRLGPIGAVPVCSGRALRGRLTRLKATRGP